MLLVLQSVNGYSKSFYKEWSYGKLGKKQIAPGKQLEIKALKRYTNGKVKTFMASSVFTYLPKYDGKESIEEIIVEIKKGFGNKTWSQKKKTNGYEISTLLGKGNRVVRIQVAKGKWGFYSFASMIRPGYFRSVIPEIKSLESSFHQYARTHGKIKKYSSTWKTISNLIISQAHAAGLDGIDFGDLLGGDNDIADGINIGGGAIDVGGSIDVSGTVNVNTMNSINPGDIDRIESIMTGATDSLGDITQTFVDSNNMNVDKITTSNESIAESTNQNVSDQVDKITTSNEKITAEVNANADKQVTKITESNERIAKDFNDTANRGLDIAEKSLDKKHMAEIGAAVGFATAAGAALGGMAVNLMVSSVQGISAYIWELITDDKSEALRYKNFNKALGQWEKVNKEIGQLEKTFDRFLKSFEKLDGMNSKDIVNQLNENADKLYFKAMLAKEVAEDSTVSQTCRFRAFKAAREYQRLGSNMQRIVKYSQKNGILNFTDLEGYYCEQLENIRRKLVNAELGLSRLRIALLNGQRQYFEHQEEGMEDAQDQIDFYNSNSYKKKRNTAVKDYVDAIRDIAEDDSEDKRDKWVKKCKKSKSGIGKQMARRAEQKKKDDGGGWFYSVSKAKGKLCREAYATMQNYYQDKSQMSLEQILQMAERDADLALEQSKQKNLKLNTKDYARNAVVMKNWFRKLEMEAQCKNVMSESRKRSAAYKRCEKINPQLVNLSRAVKIADENYNKKCEDRFEQFSAEAFGEQSEDEELRMLEEAEAFSKKPKAAQIADDVIENERIKAQAAGDSMSRRQSSHNRTRKSSAEMDALIEEYSSPEMDDVFGQKLNQNEYDKLYTGPSQNQDPWSNGQEEWGYEGQANS
jgi:hypothetical protein